MTVRAHSLAAYHKPAAAPQEKNAGCCAQKSLEVAGLAVQGATLIAIA